MKSWAESKQMPGHFTGSTGVKVLTPAELTSGYQAWARKVIVIYFLIYFIYLQNLAPLALYAMGFGQVTAKKNLKKLLLPFKNYFHKL